MTVSYRFAFRPSTLAIASALALATLAGCSSTDSLLAGDKIDYRTQGAKTGGLEVPPDLTQLTRDSRYQQPGGAPVSATAYQQAAPGAQATPVVTAPTKLADLRIERAGDTRYLVTKLTPEQLWPQLQGFWKDRGFTLVMDQPDVGVMETDWAENRAKLPQDVIRNTLGKVFDRLFDTGERDKYRTRVERTAAGTEVYISHRGMQEVYVTPNKDQTAWQPRKADPQLEAEMLQRLMLKLGAPEDKAQVATATNLPAAPARARLVEAGGSSTLQLDDDFDRAWRRVGLALDRTGFTVEDRDRAQGVYFVRYVDPAAASKGDGGFLGKLFSFGKNDRGPAPARYRVAVKAAGDRSTVSVLDAQGAVDNGDAGKRILGLLLDDLK